MHISYMIYIKRGYDNLNNDNYASYYDKIFIILFIEIYLSLMISMSKVFILKKSIVFEII